MSNEPNPQSVQDHESAPEHATISPRKGLVAGIVLLVAAAALAIAGILPRIHARAALDEHTKALAAPTVIALEPKPGAAVDTLVLPGNVSAYTDAPIYARTSGYLTRWYFDIGARVKKGALLAEIATPELDQQVTQAEADLATAQASATNAKLQADRYSGLVQSNAVSKQDTETYVSLAASTAAAVRSAQANVQRIKELQSFEKVYAPFDGVVTARAVDTGQLVTAGGANELFHMQALQTLRVYANIPQSSASVAKVGAKFDVTIPEQPGKTIQGTLVRTAQSIDPVSRTLLVELDVDNRAGQMLPGSLAQVHFKTPAPTQSFVVPVAALIFRREGLRVATLVDGNRAHLVPVVIGQDDGATAQIVSGLSASDKVIQDPPDALIEGEIVTPVSSRPDANGEGGR
ncbi:MAG: efflux RND transporter periplasmic adaptor subunit [Terracidiphilus sp.]|nr:efflux RND transporter periplasmic adaptor subunit [Terracidiphilus sp.]